jgi:hypothetical protein
MNKATVKLSLRKLLIATLAMGPLAILPAPLWALPATSNYTVTNGSATLTLTGSNGAGSASFQVSDRTVISWGNNGTSSYSGGTFNVQPGETWAFTGLSSTGAVLNKVGYINGVDTATISGTLQSSGKVFILANGTINVNSGAAINTSGGLVLSTLATANDFTFTTTGTPDLNGNSTGTITLGTAAGAAISAIGNVSAYAGTIKHETLSVTGDLVLNQTGAATGLVLSNSVVTTVGGNLSVVTNAGAVTQVGSLTVGGLTSITTGNVNSAVTLGNASNSFKTVSLSVGNSTTTGTSTIVGTGNVVLGASSVGQDLSVTTAGNLTTSGAVAVTGNVSLTSNSAGNITFASGSTVGNSVAASTVSGPITINVGGNLTTGAITSTAGNLISVTSGNVTTVGGAIQSAGNVSISGASIAGTGSVGNSTVAVNVATFSGTGSGGNVALPSVTASTINVTTTGGGQVSQGNSTTLLTTVGNLTINTGVTAGSTGNITLPNANAIGNSTVGANVSLTGNSISLTSAGNLVITGINAAGNVTLTTTTTGTGLVVLGNTTGTNQPVFTIPNGGLTINTNGAAVSDDQFAVENIFGALTINTTGNNTTTAGAAVTINAAAASPAGTSVGKFGQITINAGTAGNIIISKGGFLNVSGAVSGNTISLTSIGSDVSINNTVTAGTGGLTINAASGNITALGSGLVTVGNATAGSSNFRASNTTGFGINLSNTSNSFGGAVTLNGGSTDVVVANSNFTLASGSNLSSSTATITTVGSTSNKIVVSGGNYNNLTLTSGGVVVLDNSSGSAGTFRNLTINAADSSPTSVTQNTTGNSTSVPGITVNGTLTLTSAGTITLNSINNNITGNVVISNVQKDVTVYNAKNLTVSGTGFGNLTAVAGTVSANSVSFANAWNVFLGNLSVANLTAVALNGGTAIGSTANALTGNSGNITQLTGSSLFVFGAANLTTYNGNIVVANNGNNFSTLSASTGGLTGALAAYATSSGSGNITLSKDSSLRVGDLNSTGSVSLTSRFGTIFENDRAAVSINATGNLSLNAPAGAINLGNQTGTTTANIVTVNAVAGLALNLTKTTSGNLILGNINANSITVNTTPGGANITQSSTANAWVYGVSTFTSGNNISLTNPTNNFGALVLSTTNAAASISVTKASTINLRTVTMPATSTGNFTVTSVSGDIINTGFGGVKIGGTTASYGSGVVTLSAANGNITLGDATTDIPTTGGVVYNAKNVSLTVLGNSTTSLYLGNNSTASSTAGNLTVTSITGSIYNASGANIVAGGNATFTAPSGNVTLASSGNQFGTLKFQGNQVNVSQSGDMTVLTGSYATGAAQLASGGNVSISNVGGVVSFGNTIGIVANGNITLPKLIQAAGTLTVNAAGTKNLGALSVSGDLSGKTPVNLGTGAYSAPQP